MSKGGTVFSFFKVHNSYLILDLLDIPYLHIVYLQPQKIRTKTH